MGVVGAMLANSKAALRRAFPVARGGGGGRLAMFDAPPRSPAPWMLGLQDVAESAQGFLDILRARQGVGGYYDGRTLEPSVDIIRRSRILAVLCPYGQRFLGVCANEALGPGGIIPRLASTREQRRWDILSRSIGLRGESLASVMEQALTGYLRDGEVFILMVSVDGELRLQLVDPMQVDPQTGIRVDGLGTPVEYTLGSTAYPARQVIHLFRRQVPDQMRGLSSFVPAWEALGWLWQVEDRTLANIRQTAETPGYFELPPDYIPSDIVDEDADASSYTAVDEAKIRRKIPKVSGEISIFPNGMRFNPIDLGRQFAYGSQFSALRRELLASAAAALGISYAALAGEYSNANYSSLRQGRLDDIAFYKRLQSVVISAQERVYEAWLDGGGRGVVEWTTPYFAAVDPQREVQVSAQEVKTGIRSRSEIIRARGGDPDEVFRELAAERELLGAGGVGGESDDGRDDDDTDGGEDTGAGA